MIQGIPLSEFDKLTFNISQLGKTDNVLKAFVELDMRPEFKIKLKHKNTFLRYLIFMYDQESPFVKRYQNITERKANCAKEAGFLYHKKDGFSEYTTELLDGKIKEANVMTVTFIRMFNDTDWAHLQILQNQYYKTLEKSLLNEYSTSTGKNLDLLKGYIDKTKKSLVGDDKILAKTAYMVMNYEDINVRVENYIGLKV